MSQNPEFTKIEAQLMNSAVRTAPILVILKMDG